MTELRCRAATLDYPGPLRALEEVDLDLRPGDLTAVLGPNGAGKSTLLRLCAGLLAPTGGSVELDGRPVDALRPRERARRLAVVPQELRALPDVDVATFVGGGRYGHLGALRTPGPADAAAVRAALAACDVEGLGERLLTQLSGGQRQRVLIARALAQEASFLVVDEPTSWLDPEHQLATFELLARLAGEGRAVLVATHDLNLASQFASAIVILRGGRVAARGTPDEVLVPDVLEPVYGPHLRCGRWPAGPGGAERPYAVPWRGGSRSAADGAENPRELPGRGA